MSDFKTAYTPKGESKKYDLNEKVENPVKPETKAKLDKLYRR